MDISRQDRAKQFMAFDALKGLNEALKEKEQFIKIKKLGKDFNERKN